MSFFYLFNNLRFIDFSFFLSLLEFVDITKSVYKLHLASKKRVAIAANVYVDFLLCRAGYNRVATRAANFCVFKILGVNSLFHSLSILAKSGALDNLRSLFYIAGVVCGEFRLILQRLQLMFHRLIVGASLFLLTIIQREWRQKLGRCRKRKKHGPRAF